MYYFWYDDDDISKKIGHFNYWKLPHNYHIVPKKAVLSAGT